MATINLANPGATTYYGNTEAVVLDAFRSSEGVLNDYQVLANRESAHHHRSSMIWVRERQRRLQAHTRMLERNDYSSRRPAGCQTAASALSGYRGYNKLFGERKYAKKYPFVKLSRSFMDLPGEIRNHIYRLHLCVDEPIEVLTRIDPMRRTHKDAEKAADQAAERFIKIHASRLPFLRVSKAVNNEASDIFYGENEFRFTCQSGWTYLRGFMHRIGHLNVERLQRISIHVPWMAGDDKANMCRSRSAPSALEGPHRRLTGKPAGVSDYEECARILNRVGNLKNLALVLPVNLNVKYVKDLRFDFMKFKDGLEVKLIHLAQGAWEGCYISPRQLPLYKSEPEWIKEGRRYVRTGEHYFYDIGNPKDFAETVGWQYERAVLGGHGRYNHDTGEVGWEQVNFW